METKGVLDRIVDDKYAVILAEDIGKEYVINKEELPQGSSTGDWFVLTIEEDKVTKLSFDREHAQQMSERIRNKMEKVRAKGKGSKFKRN